MNLLFWNWGQKDNGELAKEAIVERNVDLAYFAESPDHKVEELAEELGSEYSVGPVGIGCDKIRSVMRKTYQSKYTQEQSRYSVSFLVSKGGLRAIVAATHLPDRRSDPDSSARMFEIRDLMGAVRSVKLSEQCENLIIIGDFNANPYDPELLQADAFNAALFKGVIRAHTERIWRGHRFEYLYNPIINWLSEDRKMYGSYYRASQSAEPYWNCFDQVLVSPSLMDRIESVEYLRSIGTKSLMARIAPDNSISDHLPLYVSVV